MATAQALLSSNYLRFNVPSVSYYMVSSRYGFCHLNPIKAMGGSDARENLNHVARQNHSSEAKRRFAPTPPIGLWDKFPTARTVQDMLQTMERMMEDPFAMSTLEWPSSPLPSEGIEEGYRRGGRTPWEIKQAKNEYKMRFNMPGMSKEDVKVWVDEEKMLVVKAEKKTTLTKIELGSQQPNGKEGHHLYGRYSSRIALPENVQLEKIKAEVKDGVLYITIPKATSYSNNLDIDVQ